MHQLGIKTGFNEAFIIAGKKKDELIAKDPKSAEIIRPILRGRDIKRYRVDFADLWLIATFPALNIDIKDYPAVRDYLQSFGRKLHQTGEVIGRDKDGSIVKSRKKTGNKWFETQDQIAYQEEFKKEKIVWPETSVDNQFSLDTKRYLLDKTCFLMVPANKYLLAVVNSEIVKCYLSLLVSKMRGGYYSMSKIYIEQVPIIRLESSDRLPFETLVDYIRITVELSQNLQSAFFQQLINGLVYELYFPDEIKTAGKEISKYLGQLTPITDDMADEKKLAIIRREFDRLHDPRHPVRNNLETLDSVEVVRVIRKALQ